MLLHLSFTFNLDGLAESQKLPLLVIPAETGIQYFQNVLDPGFRRGDGVVVISNGV